MTPGLVFLPPASLLTLLVSNVFLLCSRSTSQSGKERTPRSSLGNTHKSRGSLLRQKLNQSSSREYPRLRCCCQQTSEERRRRREYHVICAVNLTRTPLLLSRRKRDEGKADRHRKGCSLSLSRNTHTAGERKRSWHIQPLFPF